MSSLGLGLALHRGDGAIDIPHTAPIMAAVSPTMSRLYAGQAIADVPGFAAMIDPGNFTSAAGGITGISVAFVGDALDAVSTLSEGDSAGFVVTVSDDMGNERVFTAGPVTVEYLANITVTPDNEIAIDINPIAPDGESIEIVVVGTAQYDGTYAPTAGDLRGGPFALAAPSVSGMTNIGDPLTVLDGLWISRTGTLTLTRQWQRDEVDIAGATGPTHVVASADVGAALTVEVTANDGQAAAVVAETLAVDIPVPPNLTATKVLENFTTATNNSNITDTVPTGAAAPGKEVVVLFSFGQSTGTNSPAPTLGGSAPVASGERIYSAAVGTGVYIFDASAGGDLTLDIDPPAQWRSAAWVAYVIEGRLTAAFHTDSDGAYGALDVSADVLDGQVILAAAAGGNFNSTGEFAAVGLTQVYGQDDLHNNKAQRFYAELIGADEPTRPMTLTPSGNGGAAVAITSVVLG